MAQEVLKFGVSSSCHGGCLGKLSAQSIGEFDTLGLGKLGEEPVFAGDVVEVVDNPVDLANGRSLVVADTHAKSLDVTIDGTLNRTHALVEVLPVALGGDWAEVEDVTDALGRRREHV